MYVQGESPKTCAASLVEGLSTPRSPVELMAMKILAKISCTAACILLSACANHPLDCSLDFVPHDDCLPGTAGYESAQKRADLAATHLQLQKEQDDGTCQSYGLKFGTNEYAQCREKLLTLRVQQSIANQGNAAADRQAAIGYLATHQVQQRPIQPYVMPTTPTINCTTFGNTTNCQEH